MQRMPGTQILIQYFAIRPKLHSSFCTIVVILYPLTTCPDEIFLNNVEQNLQSGQLHHWATSDGAEITASLFAVIHSSRGISNPFQRIIQSFWGILQPFREIIRPFRGSTYPFRRTMDNTVCCQRTTQSLPPRLYDSPSYREWLSLIEWKQQKSWRNHDHRKPVYTSCAWSLYKYYFFCKYSE